MAHLGRNFGVLLSIIHRPLVRNPKRFVHFPPGLSADLDLRVNMQTEAQEWRTEDLCRPHSVLAKALAGSNVEVTSKLEVLEKD